MENYLLQFMPYLDRYRTPEYEKDLTDAGFDNKVHHGAAYLENFSQRLLIHVEIWLKTGEITPKTISLLKRIFREIGRRIKRIAWG
ncbi:hypothetical protein ACFL0M_07685 [Thermodesulfobacteriota bacterium]